MAKKIFINPGHSDTDPGAVGFEVERTLNVKTSQFMYDYLEANYDCELMMVSGKVSDVARIANTWDADLFVSIHNNAGGGDGYEALVSSSARLDLGKIFEKHVLAIGQNSRGVKYRPGLVVLNSTNMPAVLNEGAFVDNKKDIQDWNDDFELKKLGIAYAEAAVEYLKVEKKNTVQTVEKPVEKPVESKDEYTLKEFIKDVQSAIGAKIDGIAGTETLSKTITLSATVNRKHKLVKIVQKRLSELGYNVGTIDGIAGAKFTAAVKAFQKDNKCTADGEITARCGTWKKLLGMK